MAFMASKTDQIKINGTVYDIDLPVDATPSISSLYATVSIGTPSIYTARISSTGTLYLNASNFYLDASSNLNLYASSTNTIVGMSTYVIGSSVLGLYGNHVELQVGDTGVAAFDTSLISLGSTAWFSFPSKSGTFALTGDVSGTYENDIWLTLTIDGTTKNIPAGGGGGIPLSGTTNLSGNIIPKTSNAYTLGNTTYYFSSVYTSQVYANYIRPLAGNIVSVSATGTGAVISLYASATNNPSIYASTSGNYASVLLTASGYQPKISLRTSGTYGSICLYASGTGGQIYMSASSIISMGATFIYLSTSYPYQYIGTHNYPILHGYEHNFQCLVSSPNGVETFFTAQFLANDSTWISSINVFGQMLYNNGYTTSSTAFTNVKGYYFSWNIGGMWCSVSDTDTASHIMLVLYGGNYVNYSEHLPWDPYHGYFISDFPRDVNFGYNV